MVQYTVRTSKMETEESHCCLASVDCLSSPSHSNCACCRHNESPHGNKQALDRQTTRLDVSWRTAQCCWVRRCRCEFCACLHPRKIQTSVEHLVTARNSKLRTCSGNLTRLVVGAQVSRTSKRTYCAKCSGFNVNAAPLVHTLVSAIKGKLVSPPTAAREMLSYDCDKAH